MTIIEKYRELTENISVIEVCIDQVENEIRKLIFTYCPGDVGAIDYTKPAVQTSISQESLSSVYIKLHDLETELMDLKKEKDFLYQQRDKLEKTINDLGDIEKKVMMLRIKGYPNWKIAKHLNYSERGIENIFKRIREKQKECGANVG